MFKFTSGINIWCRIVTPKQRNEPLKQSSMSGWRKSNEKDSVKGSRQGFSVMHKTLFKFQRLCFLSQWSVIILSILSAFTSEIVNTDWYKLQKVAFKTKHVLQNINFLFLSFIMGNWFFLVLSQFIGAIVEKTHRL